MPVVDTPSASWSARGTIIFASSVGSFHGQTFVPSRRLSSRTFALLSATKILSYCDARLD